MSPMSAEATVVRNYLDWMLSMPWGKRTKVKRDIAKAAEILDTDHYGLEKVKERILEYLAVQQRTTKNRGPILCLVGPPGVGKTSLGRSIAKATGRNFVRMSLGGVRDEAEIRGHRRTYIGSMPGKVMQSMKKAKSNNPLFMLDEIDKLGADFRGDPSSALLEVLDPEQNSKFNDHYLEVDYDLSDVMFLTTANTLRMPAPLMDRMEIIRLSGYTEDEKVEIAKRHLIDKQMEAHGLKAQEWQISDSAIRDLIRYYTREAGVRNLEREIANLTRKAVRELVQNKKKSVSVSSRNLEKYAGVRKFRFGEMEETDQVGVTTGLAWTEVGGELLAIEAVTLPGKGKMMITGKLGDVMQESIQAAASYVRSRVDPVRHRAALVRKARHPYPRSRRRDPEGRAVGRRGDGDLDRVRADADSGSPRRGDDGRDHASRSGVPDRWFEGKASCCPPWRHQDRVDPAGQRKGSRGHSGEREAWDQNYPGQNGRRSAETRADSASGAYRVERKGISSCRCCEGRGRRRGWSPHTLIIAAT